MEGRGVLKDADRLSLRVCTERGPSTAQRGVRVAMQGCPIPSGYSRVPVVAVGAGGEAVVADLVVPIGEPGGAGGGLAAAALRVQRGNGLVRATCGKGRRLGKTLDSTPLSGTLRLHNAQDTAAQRCRAG